MYRRLIVIALVLGVTALFMFLKNKVLVGNQELFANMAPVVGEELTWELSFQDCRGRIQATDSKYKSLSTVLAIKPDAVKTPTILNQLRSLLLRVRKTSSPRWFVSR